LGPGYREVKDDDRELVIGRLRHSHYLNGVAHRFLEKGKDFDSTVCQEVCEFTQGSGITVNMAVYDRW
jgi:hypothetical protein